MCRGKHEEGRYDPLYSVVVVVVNSCAFARDDPSASCVGLHYNLIA